LIVALNSPLHLQVKAIVRGDEAGGNEEQDNVRSFELLFDFGIPFGSGFNVPIPLGANFALAFEGGQMHNQFIFVVFIPVGVEDEDAQGVRGSRGHDPI